MEALKNRILADGQAVGKDIVKVDSFLNHQIDAEFMYEIGEEFRKRFTDAEITKILTIEASGIAIAVCTAKSFDYPPVVFAKKAAPITMVEGFYSTSAKSFTKDEIIEIIIAKKYISPGDKILVIDDLLAYGESTLALCSLAEQAGAQIVGVGVVIEKEFQGGGTRLREKGYNLQALAVIEKIENGQILFKE